MGGASHVQGALLLAASTLTAGCGHAARVPAQTQPVVEKKPGGVPPGAVTLKISDLQVDPAKTVHIRGVISSIIHVRKVPARVVFRMSDSKETITVVIDELRDLKEGTQVELVGRYKQLPSPVDHGRQCPPRCPGPGEPPREAVFEVERFLDQR